MRRVYIFRLLLVASVAVVTVAGIPAQAADRSGVDAALVRWGFVWFDGTGVPPLYQGNSAGAVNTAARIGVGRYQVSFPDIGWPDGATAPGAGGNVQVTAYGGGTARCKVDRWDSSAEDLFVWVRCHTPAGVLVDSMFTALYHANQTFPPQDFGYALVQSDGDAPRLFQANSSGPTAVNTVLHTPTSGLYTVIMPGLIDVDGNAQVTAVGTGTGHCKLRSWRQTTADTRIVVGCHDTSGGLVDSAFSVAYTNSKVPSGRRGAYGLAEQSTSEDWSPLSKRFSTDGLVEGRLVPGQTGVYEVRLHGLPDLGATNVIVTAHGSGGTVCKVVFWVASGTGTYARVHCLSPAGTLVNHPYSILYTTNLL